MNQILRVAKRLQYHRDQADICERELQSQVSIIISSNKNGLRDWARTMKLSPQYVCDLRYGRRKISAAVLKKVLGKP